MKNVLILITLFFLGGCSSEAVIVDTENIDKVFLKNATIQYKTTTSDPNLTSLDIYTVQNSTSEKPVVIWVHGGGWAIGDKANGIEKKASFFTNLGYVFVAVNYRLSPYPTDIDDDNRIKHPTHINDVADALKWIDTNIQKYGGNNKKLALIGHSAGAHLVALAGTNQQLFNERDFNYSNIIAVISLDTQAYNVPNTINNVQGNDVYINAFSSELIVQKDASPYYQLDLFNSTVPHWLFVSRGTNFRKEELSKFSTKISKNDGNSKTIDMTGFSHSDVNNLIADKSNPILSSEIRKFLNNSFKP